MPYIIICVIMIIIIIIVGQNIMCCWNVTVLTKQANAIAVIIIILSVSKIII